MSSSQSHADDDQSEDDNCVPNTEVAAKLVAEFAELTGTDTALAQMFLQDRNWDLNRSVNAYFEAKKIGGFHVLTDGDEPQMVLNITKPVANFLESATTKPPSEIRVITWNLDGLDERNLKMRTKCVVRILNQEKPDVVFFQELVPKTYDYLEKNLPPEYKFVAGHTNDYFTATLINQFTVYYDSHKVVEYPSTLMGRDLLQVNAHVGKVQLALFNTHLESTAAHSEERIRQLRICFEEMNKVEQQRTVIAGGDFNLRDKEVGSIGGLPPGIDDVWIACGSRKECEFTWDALRNTNKDIPSQFKPRMRFDRLFIRSSQPRAVIPKFFGLIGLQKIAGYQCFPSDHWGILADFDLKSL